MGAPRGFRLAAGSSVVLLALLAADCGPSSRSVEGPERELVTRLGQAAAADLAAALQPRLLRALAQGGPVFAIALCADTAQALTSSVSTALGGGIALKRTSFRYRNPANAPDEDEAAALRYFEEKLAQTKELPEDFVQRAADGSYRYYRSLTVQAPCLGCHGPAEAIPEDVRRILAERYPDDRAVGYREGEFRGVIRVTVPARSVESGS